MITILAIGGCIVTTMLVVVIWSALVLGARCDEAQRKALEYAQALEALLASGDKATYPREGEK